MDMQVKAIRIRAQASEVQEKELSIIEREITLRDRLAGTNIGQDAQTEIGRRLMLVINNQAEKNAMIDATISDEDKK